MQPPHAKSFTLLHAKPFRDLCPYYMMCDGGAKSNPIRGLEDVPESEWVPILDAENEWVNLNDNQLKCTKISAAIDPVTNKVMGKPAWGKIPGAKWSKTLSFPDINKDPIVHRKIMVRPLCCRPAHFAYHDVGHCYTGYELDRKYECVPRKCKKPAHCKVVMRDPGCFDPKAKNTAAPRSAQCQVCEDGYECQDTFSRPKVLCESHLQGTTRYVPIQFPCDASFTVSVVELL